MKSDILHFTSFSSLFCSNCTGRNISPIGAALDQQIWVKGNFKLRTTFQSHLPRMSYQLLRPSDFGWALSHQVYRHAMVSRGSCPYQSLIRHHQSSSPGPCFPTAGVCFQERHLYSMGEVSRPIRIEAAADHLSNVVAGKLVVTRRESAHRSRECDGLLIEGRKLLDVSVLAFRMPVSWLTVC
jgi:hypothetical protein